MDFLANENSPLLSARRLREAGHRVVSVIQEAPGSKDEDILKRAHNESLIILTFDRDYGELIYRHQALPPAGVVYFRFAPATPSEPAEILINVMDSMIALISAARVSRENGLAPVLRSSLLRRMERRAARWPACCRPGQDASMGQQIFTPGTAKQSANSPGN